MWKGPAAGLAEPVDADVASDPKAPGAQARPALVVLRASPPGPLQDVLHRVLSVEGRTQHLVAERPQPAAQTLQLLRGDRAHAPIVSEGHRRGHQQSLTYGRAIPLLCQPARHKRQQLHGQ